MVWYPLLSAYIAKEYVNGFDVVICTVLVDSIHYLSTLHRFALVALGQYHDCYNDNKHPYV